MQVVFYNCEIQINLQVGYFGGGGGLDYLEVHTNYDVGAPSSLAICKHLTEHPSQFVLEH